jgi:hypothetical protein
MKTTKANLIINDEINSFLENVRVGSLYHLIDNLLEKVKKTMTKKRPNITNWNGMAYLMKKELTNAKVTI